MLNLFQHPYIVLVCNEDGCDQRFYRLFTSILLIEFQTQFYSQIRSDAMLNTTDSV